MKVLIALTPRMYSETLLDSLSCKRPKWRIFTVWPENLHEAVEVYGPDAIIRVDETNVEEFPDVISLITIDISDSLEARVRSDGRIEKVQDINLDTVLRAFDVADKRSGNSSA